MFQLEGTYYDYLTQPPDNFRADWKFSQIQGIIQMPLNLVSFKNIDTCGLPAGSAPELPPRVWLSTRCRSHSWGIGFAFQLKNFSTFFDDINGGGIESFCLWVERDQ